MRPRASLPRSLGDHFSVQQAAARGVGRSRRDADDLHRPFHGVRATQPAETFHEVLHSYAPRMGADHRCSGRTAMRLWGMPLPWLWSHDEPVHIVVPTDAAPPRTRGVQGHRLASGRAVTWRVEGIDVIDPVSALFTCAGELTVDQAVIALDALVTTASNYPGLRTTGAGVTTDQVAEQLTWWGRFRGCRTVRTALPRVRECVESPKETQTRLLIRAAGLAEPLVQVTVRDFRGRFVARVDLAYPQWRIAIEYEGDGHRRDKAQWRINIRRQRGLEDLGWIVIRLTESDLRTPVDFLTHLRNAILLRTGT